MNDAALQQDQQARRDALDIGASIICEAPAGSGKTELLTQRFLKLLAHVDEPEAILAITFTRKATAEMRNRILEALLFARDNPEPEEGHKRLTWQLARAALSRDEAQQWHLLDNPNRLQIRTFDSLASYLGNRLPIAAGLGQGTALNQEPDQRYREAASQLLSFLEGDDDTAQALASLLAHMDNDFNRLVELFASLLKNRLEWLPYVSHGEAPGEIRRILEAELQLAFEAPVAAFKAALGPGDQAELCRLAGYAAANLKDSAPDHPTVACLDLETAQALPAADHPCWPGLLQVLLTQSLTPRKSWDKRIGFPSDNKAPKEDIKALAGRILAEPDAVDALQAIALRPSPRYTAGQWRILQDLFFLLPRLAASLDLVFKQYAETDFPDVTRRAVLALGEADAPTDLMLRMDWRLQHLLVDEFQDTSPAQYELLQKLTAGWQPDDGRSLFCVGDAMQSIYGFRGADVGLFLRCRDQGLGHLPLKPVALTRNFRSDGVIVDWVNRTFSGVFPARDDPGVGAVRYAHSLAHHPATQQSQVVCIGLNGPDDKRSEAQHIVQIIQQARAEHGEAVGVAILLRKLSRAAPILRALQQAGIAFHAVDTATLTDRPVIRDLLSLTRALLFEEDRVAWTAILRAPWCGLTLPDLHALLGAESSREQTVLQRMREVAETPIGSQTELFAENTETSLSADGEQRLKRVLNVIDAALAQRRRLGLRDWIEATWHALDGPACLQDPADRENIRSFLALLDQHDQGGEPDNWAVLEQAVNQRKATAGDPKAADVQIMTMHKAKGLQFDIVIVPGLHSRNRGDDPDLLYWHEGLNAHQQSTLLLAPAQARGRDADATVNHIQSQKKRRNEQEERRLLYVAATRAKKALYLLAHVEENDKGQRKQPAGNTPLNALWEVFEPQMTLVPLADKPAAEAHTAQRLYRLPSGWQSTLPELPSPLERYRPGRQSGSGEREETIAHEEGWTLPWDRHVGSVVHHFLQRWGESGELPETAEEISNAIQHQLRLRHLDGAPLTQAKQTVTESLNGVLNDPDGRRLLTGPFREVHREWALTVDFDGELRQMVIDLAFVDENGEAWVVDYKTSTPRQGETRDHFLTRESQTYAGQMRGYAIALGQIHGEMPKTALYFPRIRVLRAVDSEGTGNG